MEQVIKVENLCKAYQLGAFGTGTISRDLERFWAKWRGKEDPFVRIGEINDRAQKGAGEVVWSLKDLFFEVEMGDTIGIIGRNGAGKSTLLKILSRITAPTVGSVKISGRISSLLEVGTGFHPELSGRENIYLNGAILGMRRSEIKAKFDAIVDFSGVERYIDTPVKRYSSGMFVRLAFAVAAHLESEILIVDEVLAVGDAEFQKKCLGKMSDLSTGEGRTVLFVSHHLGSVQKFCKKGLYLEKGMIREYGPVDRVIDKYVNSGVRAEATYKILPPVNPEEHLAFLTGLQIEDIKGCPLSEIKVGEPWQVRIWLTAVTGINHFIIALGISDSRDIYIRTSWSEPEDIGKGKYEVIFREDQLLLATGTYNLTIGLSSYEKNIQYAEHIANINISMLMADSLNKSIIRTSGTGVLLNPMKVTIVNI
jgi:ABC-type polysaccharide/polyol phosphate transport system ATPase subunit